MTSALKCTISIVKSVGTTIYLIELRLPNTPTSIAGVLIWDAQSEELELCFRDKWHEVVADAEDAEILAGYQQHMSGLIEELGFEGFLHFAENNLTNVISLSPPYQINRPKASLRSVGDALVEMLRFDRFRPVAQSD